MRSFISHAQTFDPDIPAELHNYIVAKYVEKRKFQRDGESDSSYMYVTPRTLLGIIRLSQAMAKLCFRDVVNQADVDEAIKLMDFSFRSLNSKSGNAKDKRRAADGNNEDRMTLIMRGARRVYENRGNKPLAVNDLLNLINKQDITVLNREELMDVLTYYKRLNVVFINTDDQVMWL